MAQVAFGDMALSVIDELPPGRLPISTCVLLDSAEHRDEVPAVTTVAYTHVLLSQPGLNLTLKVHSRGSAAIS